MPYNGTAPPYYQGPVDHTTAILLDQSRELREQSRMLGWLVSHQQTGAETVRSLDRRVSVLEKAPQPRRQSRAMEASMLLKAARPYVIALLLIGGKYLGYAPSWLEPLAIKLIGLL